MTDEGEACKSEISTVFGRCRCCLEYGYMKNMWEEHYTAGEREIYGEMIMETFSIAWDTSSEGKAHICDFCVTRVRDATNFKREMLASEHLLAEDSDDENMTKADDDPTWYEYKEEPSEEEEVEEIGEYSEGGEEERLEDEVEEANPQTVEYEEVEYLDEDALVVEGTSKKAKLDPPPVTKTTRWPRKKKPEEISRPYKNYSEEDMRKAIQSVREGEMSIADAARHYRVPRKTITAKLHTLKNKPLETPEEVSKQESQEKNYHFVKEVKDVLTYTTAVPFKVKTSKYFCAYCYTKIDYFVSPAALRTHMKNHEGETKHIDRMLRPHFQNEILRVDIEKFRCKVCSESLATWNDMFKHMNEQHDILFDQAYTRLIPYKLTGETVYCALCSQEFQNFPHLDAHMNAHYANYMCSDCGDTFVTEVRLKQHQLIHNTGKYPCRYCGKIFSLEKYRKKHEGMVHFDSKLFKCMDCGEQFHKLYDRHLHTMEKHPERVRSSTCELCGKVFDWRPYYLAHLKKAHSKVKKNECSYCPKKFVTKHEMKMHEMRHTGGGKHVCAFCEKNFVTFTELKKHLNKHINEGREIHVIQEQTEVVS